jgi:methyltransferase family protein
MISSGATSISNPSPDDLPITIGTLQEFARAREFFDQAQFNERAVCAALQIRDIAGSRDLRTGNIDYASVPPPLCAAIELFIRGRPLSRNDFQKFCGDEIFAAFGALGLIREAQHRDGAVVCPVWVYPVDGFVIASDRRDEADGGIHHPRGDAVFPGLDTGTLRLLRLLPEVGGDALDLCGGCGIGALHLSRTAQRAVSADIAQRSAYFAKFNAQLNGVDIESAQGDLYAPVADRQFDVVAAHPPWVPSTGDAMVFRDGGDGGETIIRRIIEEMPSHLRCGGTGVVVSLGRDTTEAAYERQVRGWLGEPGRDCDVILGVEKLLSIEEVVGSIRHLGDDRAQADRLTAHLRTLGTEKFVYGALFIRRTDGPITEPPLRLRMSSRALAVDFDRLFAWRRHRRSPVFCDWMKKAKPRLAPYLEVVSRQVVTDGALGADETMLRAEYAFSTALRLDSWVIPMMASFEGSQTVEKVFAASCRSNRSPSNFTLSAFVDLVALMIEHGFLEVDFAPQARRCP